MTNLTAQHASTGIGLNQDDLLLSRPQPLYYIKYIQPLIVKDLLLRGKFRLLNVYLDTEGKNERNLNSASIQPNTPCTV